MTKELQKEFDEILANLEILPTNNAKNVEKYVEYIDGYLNKYTQLFKDAESEINARYTETLSKYSTLKFEEGNISINYNSFKLSDSRVPSDEKMNLPYLFYKLRNSTSQNLQEVNNIILEIQDSFKTVGVLLVDKDFDISENVNLYMKSLLSNSDNIQDIFNSIFWKTSNLLGQIELNYRYLYNKHKSKIDDYFKQKYANFDYNKYLNSHRDLVYSNDLAKHSSLKYIYDLFINGTYEVEDFVSESRVQNLFNKVLADSSSDRNYECLIKLKKSLVEYKGYLDYEYIIKDFKELYSHQAEYKDLFSNKLKEIGKKESTIISLNKKINKTGLFKLSKKKLDIALTERNRLIDELINDYKDLDDLRIKDCIVNNVTPESSLYNILVFTSYNLVYFVSLLERQGEEITVELVNKHMLNLQKYLYDNYIDIINNVYINEDKQIDKIIVEMYKRNSIILTEEDITIDAISKYIESVDKLITYFDVYTVMINLKDVDFILKVPNVLKK